MVEINLELKDIYKALCPKCQKKVIDLAASEGARAAVRDSLLEQFKDGNEDGME